MTDSSIARITGMFGISCVLLSWAQFPLWVLALVSAAVWLAVTLAADGLMGGAALATLPWPTSHR